MKQLKKTILTLVALLAVTTGAWADDYTITLPTVSNGSVVAKVSDVSVTSAAADATVSLVATPDAGYKLKTISATPNISETFSSGANTRTGTYFSVSGNNIAQGWRVGNSAHYTLTISSLSNQNLSQVVLTVGGPKTATQRNISHLQVDHGAVSATGTAQGSTVTITGINSPTVVVSAPGSGNAGSMWTFTQAKVDVLLGAITLTDTSDDNVKTFTMPSSNVTVSAEFEEGPASSGPEVAWDKAKKTGSFTMPGGNVTLEPEYYPQAALTAAPTAIDNVPATTDGAIVNAGTVANIGETANAQGTVMYYVSPTALDDAALLALAADKWKADVPTAADLAQGQAYVYYYVRGNDSDNDDEIFSDGDILAANALTVTLGAAPLWNAEFDLTNAPEEDKAGKWSTDIPEGGVVKGTPVTVTYTGSKKVIGVKAEKKAAAGIVNPVVGQIIGSDGKNYDANATLPSGVTAVAKIAYVGNDAETSTTYNHGLALALGDVSDKKAWCSQYQKTCLTTQYGSADAAKGDMAGIANTDALVNHTGHSHAAASAARDYNGGTHPMGTSEWFLPSAGQWDKMASAAGGYVKLRTNAGLQSDYYWSSTERDASYAWYFSSHNGDWLKDYKDMYSHRVRACLAF